MIYEKTATYRTSEGRFADADAAANYPRSKGLGRGVAEPK